MTAPLTLIVEGKPLVFDVPVPVGEVIPAGTWFAWQAHGRSGLELIQHDQTCLSGSNYLLPRPPAAPESFADGDVVWVRVGRNFDRWLDPDGDEVETIGDSDIRRWSTAGWVLIDARPRPESLADVLDDANLPDELRARIEKAVER